MLNRFKEKYGVTKPVFLLGAASLFSDAASEMIYPLLPLFLTKHLGASAVFIGLVEGVADSTAAIAKYLFGWLSDRLRKRTPFVVGGYAIANLFRPLIGISGVPWHVLILRFADRVGKGMRTAPRDAWLASLSERQKRGTIFGFHRAMDHAGAVVGPLLATTFLWLYPGQLRLLFLWSIVPGLMAAGFVIAAKKASREPIKSYPESKPPVSPIVIPPTFKRYLAILSVFTLGSSSDVFLLLKLQTAGLEIKWVPLSWSALHIVKSLGSIPGGRLSDRIGRRRSIALGWLIFAGVYVVLGMSDRMDLVITAFLLYGLFPALTESAEKAFVSELVHENARGTAFGLHNLVTGLGAFPASLLFGFLWTNGGPQLAFLTGAALALVACFFLSSLSLPNHFDRAIGAGGYRGRDAAD